jgi:hypothetical protein
MLRQVSNGQYLEAIRMAEKFILHVEVLFATIDDLEYHFARIAVKGSVPQLNLLFFNMLMAPCKGCPTYASHECSAVRRSIFLRCCRTHKKQALGGWA